MFGVFAINEILRYEEPGSPVPALYATLATKKTPTSKRALCPKYWEGTEASRPQTSQTWSPSKRRNRGNIDDWMSQRCLLFWFFKLQLLIWSIWWKCLRCEKLQFRGAGGRGVPTFPFLVSTTSSFSSLCFTWLAKNELLRTIFKILLRIITRISLELYNHHHPPDLIKILIKLIALP